MFRGCVSRVVDVLGLLGVDVVDVALGRGAAEVRRIAVDHGVAAVRGRGRCDLSRPQRRGVALIVDGVAPRGILLSS